MPCSAITWKLRPTPLPRSHTHFLIFGKPFQSGFRCRRSSVYPITTRLRTFRALSKRLFRNLHDYLMAGSLTSAQAPPFQRAFELFLLESSRQTSLSIELTPPEQARLRVITCLRIMDQELRFNICKFPSSFLRNKDLPNSSATVEAHISPHLRYACDHWAEHVSEVETLDVDLIQMLSSFFSDSFPALARGDEHSRPFATPCTPETRCNAGM